MANYCGGRWRSSSSIPNSRCPSLSQLQGVDFEQLFGNIQGSTEPAPFVDHVGHLLPDIPQAQSTQYVRPNRSEPSAFVEYMIQRGDEALYKRQIAQFYGYEPQALLGAVGIDDKIEKVIPCKAKAQQEQWFYMASMV